MKKSIIYILLLLSFASCRVMHSNQMFKTEKNYKYSEFKPSEKEYRIKPFDKLDIRVYTNDGYKLVDATITGGQQAQQSVPYLVEYDGKIKVPTLGFVDIAGKTIREANDMLENLYSKYYKNPFVLTEVTNRRVIIFSSGSENGTVLEMKNENFNLIEALAEVGGISDFSKSHKIKLLRGDLNNPEIYMFDIRTIKDMQRANFLLQANDIIYVEARPRYASKILTELTPYLSLITTALLVYGLFN